MQNRYLRPARRGLPARLLFSVTPVLLCAACEDGPSPPRATAVQTAQPMAAAEPAAIAPSPSEAELESIDAPALFEYMRSLKKRGTVVNVWASWCGSCRGEVPMLLRLRAAFASEGLEFVFVTADEQPNLPKAVELMRSWSGPLPTFAVAGKMTPFKRAMHPRWKGAIPATFLFDETGKLRHFWEGPVLEHEVSPILQGFLAGEPIDGETRPPLVGENE